MQRCGISKLEFVRPYSKEEGFKQGAFSQGHLDVPLEVSVSNYMG